MRLKLLMAVGALAFGSTVAQAQSASTIQTFTRADFKQALDEIGATYEDVDGRRNIDITFEGGVLADGLLLACEDEAKEKNCYGTSILATFEADEGTDAKKIQEAVNTYNYRENFGRAYVDPDGIISVRLYVISDGGITRENYRRQISLFTASLEDFFSYLYGE